jgi:hypothetical protein
MEFIRRNRQWLGMVLGVGFVFSTLKVVTQFHVPLVPSLIVVILLFYLGYFLFIRLLE